MINGTSVYYLDTLPYLHKGRAVALGFFDGIHIGHTEIIRKTVKTAVLEGLTSTVQTFVNFGKDGQGLLTTIEEKREILSSIGVDEMLVLDFDSVKDMAPATFCDEILNVKLSSRALFAGCDYRFGKDAAGDVEMLRSFGARIGADIDIFEDKLYGDSKRRVSSTWLREALDKGEPELYSALCAGRPFSYSGVVVKGNELGRKLGFPTANIEVPEDKFEVKRGVYVSRVIIGSRKLYGVTNVGVKPTVESESALLAETFIFGFDEDIYGARIKVELLKFLRPEQKFDSVETLANTVSADKERAKTTLAKSGIIV